MIQVHELESRERVMREEIHIAGSTALGAFVVDINFIWLCLLSWAYLVLEYTCPQAITTNPSIPHVTAHECKEEEECILKHVELL